MLFLLLSILAILAQLPREVTLTPRPRVLTRARKRINRTRIATLNCRTLLADETLQDLDIALTDNKVTLCALQEVRRDGFTSTFTDNFKVYWFGEGSGQRGVGFALHKHYVHLVKAVHPIPGSNGRIMTMDIFLHDNNTPVTVVCAYSPPNSAPTRVREKFYSQLRTVAKPTAWLLGDFNARVGRSISNTDEEYGVEHYNTVGPRSLKGDIVPNANGSLLLDIAGESDYRHVSSHFTIRDSKRWTWKHPRYNTRAVLDHIFVPATQMRNISCYIVAQHTAVYTDHRLAICELSFRPRLEKNEIKRTPPINRSKLQDTAVRDAFEERVTSLLGTVDPETLSTDELSDKIRSVPVTAASSVLPLTPKTKYPEEFSANTISLISRKRKLWKFLQKAGQRITRTKRAAYRSLCQATKRAISLDRITTLEKEAIALSDAFKVNRFNGYKLLKQQHRTRLKPIMPPESEFTEHYRKHYQAGNEEPLHVDSCELPVIESDETLTRNDFANGLRHLNDNRAAGHDKCAPEYLKRGGPLLLNWIYVLMVRIWTFTSDLPVIDRIGSLMPIPKKSSSLSVDSTRPICLLTSVYKLYAILLFQRVRDRVREYVTWTQAGFIRGRSCANNLWILRRVAERAVEFNVPVYCALIDYKGAFDALNRTTLGRVLALFLSPSMTRRVLSLYFDARAKVVVNNCVGPEFSLHRGVRQGCPASPSFFTVALAFISRSFRIAFEGIKLIHLHLATLEYADDQILFSLTAAGMQEMLNFIVDTGTPFGLRLSPTKCELICFHRPGTVDKTTLPVVTVGGKALSWKQSVVYLGSCVAEDGNTISAIKHRICCAESVVKKLNNRVFNRRSVNSKLKGHFISSAVFASLLYGLEHCSFGIRDRRRIDGFFLRLAKRVLHLRYDHHLSYEVAEERLGIERPSARLARDRLRWTGHMLRSEDDVLREALLFTPTGGARGRGRPRRRYYDTIKLDLQDRNIVITARTPSLFWEEVRELAANRLEWQAIVKRRR